MNRAAIDLRIGVASMRIAGRTNDVALAEAALRLIEAALELLRSSGQLPAFSRYETLLTRASAILDELKARRG